MRAHPRSRGENYVRPVSAASASGSSPLTRGKLPRPRRGHRRRGLIPAHAGKTCIVNIFKNTHWAHPRSRGENLSSQSTCEGALGSSPLTRGKQAAHDGLQDDLGLIPAHAGKTKGRRLSGRGMGAHPRSRGENYISLRLNGHRGGSSPLTRGKPTRRSRARSPTRLIPAHAGKTARTVVSSGWHRAHPRSRGENFFAEPLAKTGAGSSPLTRGKRGNELPHRLDPGLIPAHAGKTAPAPRTCA